MDSEGSGGNSGDDHRSDHIGGHASFWIYLIVVYGGCWKIGSEIWYGWLSTRCRKKFFVDTRCIVNVTQLLLFNLVGFPVLGAVVGIPVVLRFLLYSLLQGLWRLAVAVASVPVEWAKRVYVRRQQAAIDYLSNFPDESKRRWRSRGWLVMLRARHQNFVAHQQQQLGSPCWVCMRKLKHLCGVTVHDPLFNAGGEPSIDTNRDTDKELCEEGNSNQRFAQALVTVVGLAEEGIFRHIVLYL